ncbi:MULTISPECIES: ABC transporter permease [Streptomycetaceae]|uniref:ABC transporter integral membrane protein n=1 Tax=Streptantibioticus cattleyicolor (strain ATCC 35852 / DSM 46488 / JCM 4925 / NBRC 14057 / NRRL 8057) TaxID=1003195 RepID=F8K3L6_STREN|nr:MULTISPECIES: ABC transporter permease subunit [Streptomycetaceae]AEW96335.1 ABC transporter integral membrane protein [Streptantibioticus cattleyicolor NRRL 8057 = DSM 46488]MYS60850.1 ABC transporter permease subunit [Streptomyces sp. SID5468]CCB76675.1 putative peptide ABC transporter permease protein [Streptantibioticus cattleyicolor NRRL 8057 = DSM 46488]
MTSPTQAATEPEPAPEEAPANAGSPAAPELVGRSPRQLAWARFKRDKTGIICACIVGVFLLVAIFAPVITGLTGKSPYKFYGQDDGLLNSYGYPIKPNGGIDGSHWFGIEPQLGRDIFALLVYGIRTSLGVALCVTILSVVAGVLVGLIQGYMGGRTDYFAGRFSDLMMSFPQQLFFIAFAPVIAAIFVRPGAQESTFIRFTALVLVQFALGWMSMGRLVRAQVLSLREREYIEAAKLSGASTWRIIRKEVLPNVWSTILVQATLLLPVNVTAEAGLSYLGVGMQDPTPDWGLMFQKAANFYQSDITFMFFPGIAMALFVIAFNLLGDSVRDALDPKTIR